MQHSLTYARVQTLDTHDACTGQNLTYAWTNSGIAQNYYRVVVHTSDDDGLKVSVAAYDSGWQASSDTLHNGPALPEAPYQWRVLVDDDADHGDELDPGEGPYYDCAPSNINTFSVMPCTRATPTTSATVTTTPARPFASLQLLSICDGLWMIRNANPYDVSFTWNIYGRPENGIDVAIGTTGNETYHDTPLWNATCDEAGTSRTMLIYVNGYFNTTNASNCRSCTAPNETDATPFETLTLAGVCDGRWQVWNNNTYAVNFTWDVADSAENGTLLAAANNSTYFNTTSCALNNASMTVRIYVNGYLNATNTSGCRPCTPTPPMATIYVNVCHDYNWALTGISWEKTGQNGRWLPMHATGLRLSGNLSHPTRLNITQVDTSDWPDEVMIHLSGTDLSCRVNLLLNARIEINMCGCAFDSDPTYAY